MDFWCALCAWKCHLLRKSLSAKHQQDATLHRLPKIFPQAGTHNSSKSIDFHILEQPLALLCCCCLLDFLALHVPPSTCFSSFKLRWGSGRECQKAMANLELVSIGGDRAFMEFLSPILCVVNEMHATCCCETLFSERPVQCG